MESEEAKQERGDLALIRDIIGGAKGAWERFLRCHGNLIYSFCHLVFPRDHVDEEYLDILRHLRAHDFSELRAFNGRGKLSTYLTLRLGDLLAKRIQHLFHDETERAWRAFESFFKNDISRIIAKQFPASSRREISDAIGNREDLYQEICCLFVENGYRRILNYDGRGSFTGYIRRTVQNVCMDVRRKTEGRRRVPEGILRLSELEQKVFKLLYWNGCAEADLIHILRDTEGENYSSDRIEQAIARVRDALSSGRSARKVHGGERADAVSLSWAAERGTIKERDVADLDLSPEVVLITAEEETQQEQAFARLQQALAELPPDERLYIRLRYYATPAKSPQDIAQIMSRSEEEIYKLRRKATSSLKAALNI
jgi:RNA polymerase primary sigma factor